MSQIKLGLTGQIATGKSLVLNLFKYHNFFIIDCDTLARKIMNTDENCINKLKSHFGDDIIVNNEIDRKKLGSLVFNSADQLKELNKIVHPFLFSNVKYIIEHTKKNIIVDAAVLFEAKLHTLVDKIIMVDAFKYLQIERLQKRNNISRKYAEKIINSQTPKKIMKQNSDFIIKNNTDKFYVSEQVNEICKKIKKEYKKMPKAGIEPA